MNPPPHRLLGELESYCQALQDAALDHDQPLPTPPVIPADASLAPSDVEAAGELLTLIQATEERLNGLKLRVAGELAEMRRPGRPTLRRSPRTLDTSA